MTAFFGLVPLKDWLYLAAIAAIVAAAGLFIHHERGVGAAKVEVVRQAERAQAAAVAASAIAANQIETTRRETTQAEVSHEADRFNAAATVASHDAAGAAARLLERVAAASRGSAADHPDATPAGPPASAPDDVRDLVLARALDAARLAAAYADAAHIAGHACETDYDTLTGATK